MPEPSIISIPEKRGESFSIACAEAEAVLMLTVEAYFCDVGKT